MAHSDIITLDSLAEKLRPWSPKDADHVFAVVDMGRLVGANVPNLKAPVNLE
jgi:hypothetical protein